MSWFDGHSTYVRARWSISQSLPWRIAFWLATDTINKPYFYVNNDNQNLTFIQVGMDQAQKIFAEQAQYVTFPTPVQRIGRATSPFVVSRHEWVHVIAEFLAANDRRIYVNGANQGTNTTVVQGSGGLEVHWGANADNANPPNDFPFPNISGTFGEVHDDMCRGYIEDFTHWRGISATGLSAADALRMYKMGRSNRYFEPGLIQHYLPFHGSLIHDQFDTAPWGTKPIVKSRQWAACEYTGVPAVNDNIRIGAKVYRFVDTLSAANDIKRDVSASITFGRVAKAMDLDGISGTDYDAATAANADCFAYNLPGRRGNLLADALFVYAKDPDNNATISFVSPVNVAGAMVFIDVNNNTVTKLALRTNRLEPKRGDFFFNGDGSDPVEPNSLGANNHGHGAPINWGVPLAYHRQVFQEADAVVSREFHIGGSWERGRIAYAG